MPEKALTSLSHHMDVEWMKEAHRRTRKDGAAGIDGQTGKVYEEHLEENLTELLNRAKSGDRYRAPAVRRVYIPKGDGGKRPLGIPTYEDKVLQRSVVMLLEPLYEQDFLECSYGFRPGRSAHQALQAIWNHIMEMGGGWVLEVDIRRFFDSVDHRHLREIIAKRMRDGVIVRLIGKWLKAGVLEEGVITHPETGTPQGGVISPMLANIYLHEVVDLWFEQEVKPRMYGKARMVRYADDMVMIFGREEDARRVLDVLPKRFAKYGLELHPDKTKLLRFEKPERGGPEKFEFLGFSHYWGKSQKGSWVVKRKTAKERFARALKKMSEWLKSNRHEPIGYQQQKLAQKLKGHYQYYGITGNWRSISRFQTMVQRLWKKWLSRRSQRGRLNWERFLRLLESYPLPQAVCVHSVLRHAANP
jgi:group II intron reverse transcriptase/maturase